MIIHRAIDYFRIILTKQNNTQSISHKSHKMKTAVITTIVVSLASAVVAAPTSPVSIPYTDQIITLDQMYPACPRGV